MAQGLFPAHSPGAVSLSGTAIKGKDVTSGSGSLWAAKLREVFWINVTMCLLCTYMIPQAHTFGHCQRQGTGWSFG